ncbi:hypothetical protein RRG08_049232 [Elysia crispata]|uniref:Uncharacterized protein n=1 Tax=Elysia crispata TaxID=231223 RepID=A0AAE0YTX5_9GAST|nr:hypothetical protein RRG08_049232 [Elysia crispata]
MREICCEPWSSMPVANASRKRPGPRGAPTLTNDYELVMGRPISSEDNGLLLLDIDQGKGDEYAFNHADPSLFFRSTGRRTRSRGKLRQRGALWRVIITDVAARPGLELTWTLLARRDTCPRVALSLTPRGKKRCTPLEVFTVNTQFDADLDSLHADPSPSGKAWKARIIGDDDVAPGKVGPNLFHPSFPPLTLRDLSKFQDVLWC